jgi:hypothetical protein
MVAALLVGLAMPAGAVEEQPSVLTVRPPLRKVRLRVGDRQEFAVEAVGGERVVSFWTLDGRPIPGTLPTLPAWTFTPQPWHVGFHHVALEAHGRMTVLQRSWTVRVEPARPPKLVGTAPELTTVEVEQDQPLELRSAPTRARRERPGHGRSTACPGEGDTLLQPPHPADSGASWPGKPRIGDRARWESPSADRMMAGAARRQ